MVNTFDLIPGLIERICSLPRPQKSQVPLVHFQLEVVAEGEVTVLEREPHRGEGIKENQTAPDSKNELASEPIGEAIALM